MGRAGQGPSSWTRDSGAARVAELKKDCGARVECGARSIFVWQREEDVKEFPSVGKTSRVAMFRRERRHIELGNKDIRVIFIS